MFPGNRLTKCGVYLVMFEQIAAADRLTKGKWTVLASLSSQCLAVGFAMLIPLVYTQKLQLGAWEQLPLPAPAPPPPEPVQASEPVRPAPHTTKVFTAPAAIPPHVAMIVEEAAMPLSGSEMVVSGSAPSNSGLTNILPALLDHPALPPPIAIEAPKPAEHASLAPLHVSGGVQAAKLLRRVVPAYPELAKRARVSGTVHLIGVIGKDGTIQKLEVVSGHPLLVNAAVEAVRQWLYQPTLLSGEPVEVIAPIEVNFQLN